MPMNAYCGDWCFDNAPSEWGSFVLGYASGIVAHELCHYSWPVPGDKVDHDGLAVVYSGAAFTDADQ